MADALICDNCGDKLILDGPGGREDKAGESCDWIEVGHRDGPAYDACTRSCATALLADDGPMASADAALLEEDSTDGS